jgi:hypothetical protein
MTLLDYYRADLASLSTKEARRRKVHWHRAAVRYLNMLALTADPTPPHHREGDITIAPCDGFFLRFDRSELEELYRLTKRRG